MSGTYFHGSWQELTPRHLRCGTGGCPAVFRSPAGSLVVVGRTVPTEANSFLEGRVSAHEAAVEIDPAFFTDLVRYQT
jgi:hypothetical protein